MNASSEESLIRAAALGDRIAFDDLVRHHLKPLLRYATRLTGSVTTAEDITQETFLAAWRGLPNFAFESSFRTWLFTIASRKTIDLRRRQAAIPVTGEAFEGTEERAPGPDAQALSHSLLEALQDELGKLSYHSRASWWLREVEGLSHDEIATTLSITRGSVRGHLQRARAQLAERLAPWNPGGDHQDRDGQSDKHDRGGEEHP